MFLCKCFCYFSFSPSRCICLFFFVFFFFAHLFPSVVHNATKHVDGFWWNLSKNFVRIGWHIHHRLHAVFEVFFEPRGACFETLRKIQNWARIITLHTHKCTHRDAHDAHIQHNDISSTCHNQEIIWTFSQLDQMQARLMQSHTRTHNTHKRMHAHSIYIRTIHVAYPGNDLNILATRPPKSKPTTCNRKGSSAALAIPWSPWTWHARLFNS